MAERIFILKRQVNKHEDTRIQDILNLIYELASGNLEVRGTPSEKSDDLDGIIVGLNMLAEEISDSVLKINRLSGLLPICAWCKKLRDDKGYWQSVEEYISERTKAEFTHGLCTECYAKIMLEEDSKKKADNNSG